MPNRMPAIVSAVLTVITLVVLAVLSLVFQMVALNGASERQGVTAMGVSLLCQGIGLILSALLAARLTNLATTKWSWNTIVAVIVSVIAGVSLGGLLSFLSFLIAIPISGIR